MNSRRRLRDTAGTSVRRYSADENTNEIFPRAGRKKNSGDLLVNIDEVRAQLGRRIARLVLDELRKARR
jgi:hypothetical protein